MEKRLQKELQGLIKDPPVGICVDQGSVSQSIEEWIVHLDGADGSLYAKEKFRLRFKFGSQYPFKPPDVVFIAPNIPKHPNVHSNGYICLSILQYEWSPALNVQAICLSVISMLSSCTGKKRPYGTPLRS